MVNNIWNATGYLYDIALFLLGGGAAKYRWMERIEELKRPFAAAFAVFFAAGLSLKLVPHVVDFNLASQFVAYAMGGPLLAIAYGLGIALLFAGNVGKGLLAFSPVGRMSLTNYIMQSVICALIFYSYGLGLYGKVSVTAGTVIAFVLFAANGVQPPVDEPVPVRSARMAVADGDIHEKTADETLKLLDTFLDTQNQALAL